jgi:hypothetical protein
MNTTTNAASDYGAAFFAFIKNPIKFRLFLLRKLPAAFFSGLKLQGVTDQRSIVLMPFKWFTKNPFRSTYFACLSMAAEMGTGLLAMAHIYRRSPKVSMLVIAVEGKFYKKAVGVTRFVCEEGVAIKETVQKTMELNHPQTIRVLSSGYNESNELVAEFWITWSFKTKQ